MRLRHVDVTRAIAAVACMLAVAAPSSPSASLTAHAGRDASVFAERFDAIHRTTRERFYDRAMNGRDWGAIGARYRPRAVFAASRAAFEALVNQMLGELGASHTGYYTDDDFEYYFLRSVFAQDMSRFRAPHIGVTGVREPEGYRVGAVLEGGPAARAGIHVGDLLTTVDGAPFTTVGAFRGRAGRPVRVALRRPDGGPTAIVVTPVEENLQQAFLDATRRSVRVIDRAGRRIGYIHLWTMSHPRFREVLEQALRDDLRDTDGLLLDMRDGFGGSGLGLIDLFVPSSTRDWVRTEAPARGVGRLRYTRPMVVLINHGTRSAKEGFVYALQRAGRATLVGTRTAGAYLGSMGFDIGPDGLLVLPVRRPAGTRLEGIGVQPDVEVQPHDTYGPNDRQLARAIDALASRIRPQPVLSARAPGVIRRGYLGPGPVGTRAGTTLDSPKQ